MLFDLFLSGFLHTTSSSRSGFAWDIYLDRGCFFRVFRTLYHPVPPVLLGTLTWTEGLFLFEFLAQDMYPDRGVFFFSGFPGTTSHRCSHLFRTFFRIFLRHLPRHGRCFFQVFLPDLKSDALENSAFSPAIYLHSRVTSLDLGIGPNYYL